MSKHATVLQKAVAEAAVAQAAVPQQGARVKRKDQALPGEYHELILRLFQRPTAVAVMCGNSRGASAVCESVAMELGALGKRVVVVAVDKLLRLNPIPVPDETAFVAGRVPNVWIWPSPFGPPIEFFKSRDPEGAGNWLEVLRRSFDAVLLDCEGVQTLADAAGVAAMADRAVVVVEAGKTQKQQIQRHQDALQLRGVGLAGYVMVRQR